MVFPSMVPWPVEQGMRGHGKDGDYDDAVEDARCLPTPPSTSERVGHRC